MTKTFCDCCGQEDYTCKPFKFNDGTGMIDKTRDLCAYCRSRIANILDGKDKPAQLQEQPQ